MTLDFELPGELIEILKSSQKVTALTGAGISAESGVPTFRDAQTGVWAQYDPLQLATPEAFQANPRLVWEWYTWRRELILNSAPNPGHYALLQLENYYPDFLLVTQNVDGHHQAAGSQNVVELHGNIFRTRCSRDGRVIQEVVNTSGKPPRCTDCGSYLRPDVVWFGESLPEDTLETALEAARTCGVFLSVGTSTLVEPAASLPFIALEAGSTVIEINPQDTPLTPKASYSIRGASGDVLPVLLSQIN
jgi:NAD-dependent deacetylase